MSLPTWTPGALRSETASYAGKCWRVVEDQYAVATMDLVDSLDEQALLESILEETKPSTPEECRGLHYLLFTPFRYRNHKGSRFQPPGEGFGLFYAAEELRTALCEAAFWRMLVFVESPWTPWPARAPSYTAFSVKVRTDHALDLARPPLADHAEHWQAPADYAACWQLADAARAADIEAIRYRSVRDPQEGMNIALFTCRAFAARKPDERQAWLLWPGPQGVRVLRSTHPSQRFTLPPEHFAHDPRFDEMCWERD